MGVGNPKSGEEQEAEYEVAHPGLMKQYKEAQARRLSPEGQSAESGERQVRNAPPPKAKKVAGVKKAAAKK